MRSAYHNADSRPACIEGTAPRKREQQRRRAYGAGCYHAATRTPAPGRSRKTSCYCGSLPLGQAPPVRCAWTGELHSRVPVRRRRLHGLPHHPLGACGLPSAGPVHAEPGGVLLGGRDGARQSHVNPPVWLDEHGRPRPKRPCPTCGREIAVLSIPAEHLKFWGWSPWPRFASPRSYWAKVHLGDAPARP
jgi:hypothetical protein